MNRPAQGSTKVLAMIVQEWHGRLLGLFLENRLNLYFQRSVAVISKLNAASIPEIILYFDSPCFQGLMNDKANGTAQKAFI